MPVAKVTPIGEPLMSVEDVAVYLNKKVSWVYDNWRAEQIPFIRIGNQLRLRPVKLEEWLDQQMAA